MNAFVFSLVALLLSVPSLAQFSDFERDRLPVTMLAGPWRFQRGDDTRWATPGLDDSKWPLIQSAKSWAEQGYKGYTGFGWYRMRVTVPEKPSPLAIYLPAAANSYEVYANGHFIGRAGGLPPTPRVVSVFNKLYAIPENVVRSGEPLVIAIRVWRWSTVDMFPGGGLLAPPVLGDSSVLERLRTLDIHDAFWQTTDMGLNLVFNLLTATAGLALFALRRKEKEYLWFGLAQVLWSGQAMVSMGVQFLPLPFMAAGVLQLCTKAGAQFLNLEFFVTLMEQRKGRLYWVAAGAALLPIVMLIPGSLGFIDGGTGVVISTIVDLVYGICVPILLYRGAASGNREARLLLIPFTLSFSINVVGGLCSLPGMAGLQWAKAVGKSIYRITYWPFPISLYNTAGNLAMFSVIAVLILRYARSRRDEERLESELEAARAVQHVLIPEEIPSLPGYELECVYKPAGQVGGDFFQIIPLPDGDALVAIGDVSGKGMPAAMTVSMVVGMVRMLARATHSPAAILMAMNQNMKERTFGGFTTCLILHITPDGLVTAANAGHIAPYVGGNEVPVANGLPLGLTATTTYTESTFQLSPDDQLTLLTDGVLEARKADGELFGFARAASMSAQPASEIARAAELFGQNDDITVLSLTRQPRTLGEQPSWSTAAA